MEEKQKKKQLKTGKTLTLSQMKPVDREKWKKIW